MDLSNREEAARAHRARCKGRYHAVDDGAWRAYVCTACGHVSGCECVGEATDCVGDDGMPRRAREEADYIDIVFDGPPGPVCGRFVEAESPAGCSVNAGEWIDRGDGLWALRIRSDVVPPEGHKRVNIGDVRVEGPEELVDLFHAQVMADRDKRREEFERREGVVVDHAGKREEIRIDGAHTRVGVPHVDGER
jgi:hypothetical protein